MATNENIMHSKTIQLEDMDVSYCRLNTITRYI
jgi:hypothetical protein